VQQLRRLAGPAADDVPAAATAADEIRPLVHAVKAAARRVDPNVAVKVVFAPRRCGRLTQRSHVCCRACCACSKEGTGPFSTS
jgi:hypothetical protein